MLKCGSSTHTRTSLAERDERELLTEARDEVQPPLHLVQRFLVVDRALEDRDGRDVHVRVVVFEVQEQCVCWRQPFFRHQIVPPWVPEDFKRYGAPQGIGSAQASCGAASPAS